LTAPGPPCGYERVNPFLARYGNEECDRATAVGHLERFAGGNASE
jgi:hypothetical protein